MYAVQALFGQFAVGFVAVPGEGAAHGFHLLWAAALAGGDAPHSFALHVLNGDGQLAGKIVHDGESHFLMIFGGKEDGYGYAQNGVAGIRRHTQHPGAGDAGCRDSTAFQRSGCTVSALRLLSASG